MDGCPGCDALQSCLRVRSDLYANGLLPEVFLGRMIQVYLFQTQIAIQYHRFATERHSAYAF